MFMLLLALCPCTFINILFKHAQRLKSSCFFGMFFVHFELCLLLHMTIIWLGYTFFFTRKLFILYLTSSAKRWINIFCIYLDCGRTGSCKRRHPKATNKKNINWTHHEPNIVLRFFIYHHRLDWKLFFVNVCNIFYFWRVWMPIALWLGRFIVKESLQNDLFYFFFKCKQMIKPAKTFNSDMK